MEAPYKTTTIFQALMLTVFVGVSTVAMADGDPNNGKMLARGV